MTREAAVDGKPEGEAGSRRETSGRRKNRGRTEAEGETRRGNPKGGTRKPKETGNEGNPARETKGRPETKEEQRLRAFAKEVRPRPPGEVPGVRGPAHVRGRSGIIAALRPGHQQARDSGLRAPDRPAFIPQGLRVQVEHPGTDPDTVKAPAECSDVEHADGRRVATLNALAFAALQGRIEADGTQHRGDAQRRRQAVRDPLCLCEGGGQRVRGVSGQRAHHSSARVRLTGRTAGRRCQPSSSSEKSSSSAGRLVLVVLAAILTEDSEISY